MEINKFVSRKLEIKIFDDALEKFIFSLERSTIAKVLRTIDLLEEFEYHLGLPHSKKVADKLFELRIRGAQEVRIFYTFRKRHIILLYGFVKKTEKIPRKEIKVALEKRRRLDHT